MSIIIKLHGLPLNATSADVRGYFLGLTIPDGGVHIVGGDEGTVFIEFASDEDARQAMSRGDGNIKNSTVKLLLSSRTEMLSVLDTARRLQQRYKQQLQNNHDTSQNNQHHHHQVQHNANELSSSPQTQQSNQPHSQILLSQSQPQQTSVPPYMPSPFADPRILSQNYQGVMSAQQQPTPQAPPPPPQPLLPQNQIFSQFAAPPTTTAPSLLGNLNLIGAPYMGVGGAAGGGVAVGLGLNPMLVSGAAGGLSAMPPMNMGSGVASNESNVVNNRNLSPDNRVRVAGLRGGDDKLFANKRCVLAASNIPYRATSKDIIEFFSDFSLKEDCIRRRYNQKGQPTADAKIAFPSPDAAMKALKMMHKKSLCGRPVFLKPV